MNLKPGESVDQTTTYSTRTGDLNGDGFVNQLDLQIVRASFGKRLGQAGYDPAADTNADNVIDIRDLALVGRFDPPPREPSNPPR